MESNAELSGCFYVPEKGIEILNLCTATNT